MTTTITLTIGDRVKYRRADIWPHQGTITSKHAVTRQGDDCMVRWDNVVDGLSYESREALSNLVLVSM